MSENLQQAIRAIDIGDNQTAYRLLVDVIRKDPKSKDAELAWLWMSRCIDDQKKKQQCLETVLFMNPNNKTARQELEKIESEQQFVEEDRGQYRNSQGKKEYDQRTSNIDIRRMWRNPVACMFTVMILCIGSVIYMHVSATIS